MRGSGLVSLADVHPAAGTAGTRWLHLSVVPVTEMLAAALALSLVVLVSTACALLAADWRVHISADMLGQP
jgi:hypothetical protein